MRRTVFAAALLAGAIAGSVAAEPSVPAEAAPPILFAADNEPALSGDIFRLDANGHLVNLSKSPFADEYPLVSPDGRRVAFVSERGGGPGIYDVGIDGAGLRRLDPPPHQIGTSTLTPQLAWSPDSRRLAAVTGDLKSTLRILEPGHTPKVLTRSRFLFAPTWSPDGRLLTIRSLPGSARVELAYTRSGRLAWQIPATGTVSWSTQGVLAMIGTARVKIYDERGRLRFSASARAAAWSPDGTRLATVAGRALVVRTAAGNVLLTKPIHGLGESVDLSWLDNRRVLVYLYPRVAGVDIATGKVFAGSQRYFYGVRSPDNRLFAETRRRGSRFAVQVEPLPHGSTRVYGTVGGCMDDGVFEVALTNLQFVPERHSLVYESYCAEPLEGLYAVNADGTGLTRLTHDRKHDTQPSWSPDGTRIAYTRYDAVGTSCKGCPGSLVVADADGSDPRVLLTPTGDDTADTSPSWSPDGKQILFSRWSLTKNSGLYVVPAAGGTARDLHIEGFDAVWGPSRIAWTDSEGETTALWTALPDGTDREKIAQASPAHPAWSRDGRLAYADTSKNGITIVSGSAKQHVALPFIEIASLAWSPDGTRFVVVGVTKGAAVNDVYTVRTDGTGLRRLTKNIEAYAASWR
ncbi:MAG TPA: LpqB family beta-propeller domain-containing protein [Gaiellaceae bacterium]|nr:LpqB family beta-propeller domain-containing protein [Gaiellaceae bacterium]